MQFSRAPDQCIHEGCLSVMHRADQRDVSDEMRMLHQRCKEVVVEDLL